MTLPYDLLLILPPEPGFLALDHFLQSAGWEREPDRANMNAGAHEPVFVSWSHPDGDEEIDYTFDPETGFRLLELRGRQAGRWQEAVRENFGAVSAAQALGWLRSGKPQDRLRGLQAAQKLLDPSLLEAVLRLADDPHFLVRERAQEMLEAVRPSTQAGPIEIFASILDPHQRRQTLRWMLHDSPRATPGIVSAVASALADPDWEVRATAMLAAARYDLRQLSLHLERCEMPTVSRLGPVKIDREILHAAKQAVRFAFVGKPLEEPPPQASERVQTWVHLRRCVAGLPTERRDHIWLFLRSLTEPLQPGPPPPDPMPLAVLESEESYLLRGTSLHLCRVAPVEHWMGDDDPTLPSANPIHRLQPVRDLFIAEALFSADAAGEDQASAPDLLTLAEARQHCAALSQQSGSIVRLPTPDEWELAARGPDGRRFPWGNGHEAAWQIQPSPWGCMEMFGAAPQWLESDPPLTAGGNLPGPCASRKPTEPEARCALRVVVEDL